MYKLFTGSAHPELAAQVSTLCGVLLSKAEIVRFGNSEVKVTIQEDVKNRVCIIIQPTSNPTDTNLMELSFFCDALKRQEAAKVIGIIPYFGYARQNIQHRPGECVSAHVVIKLLESVGFDEVITYDLHDEGTAGIFSIPFHSLSAFSVVVPEVKKMLGTDAVKEKIVIVSPDQEGIERARTFGEELFGEDTFSSAAVNKKRDVEHIHESEALTIYGELEGKIAILVDDICTSGGTLIHAADLCLKKGATRVLAVISHHDFAGGVEKTLQESSLEAFFTTNTIPLKGSQRFPKLKEITIAPLIHEFLNKV
jgi:ribose-phosphate pyrophosphokinase